MKKNNPEIHSINNDLFTPHFDKLRNRTKRHECVNVREDYTEGIDCGVPLSVRLVNSRNGVHSAPSHFSPRVSQSLTENLLDNSEHSLDSLVSEICVLDDWSEAAMGWRIVVPYPKYVVGHQNRTQHRAESAPKKPFPKVQSEFRFVHENDVEKRFCPLNASVEPVTYSYIPNNGCYRNNKSGPSKLTSEVREWLEMRNGMSVKSVLTKQLEKAQKLQKAHFENSENTCGKEDEATDTTQPSEEQDLTIKSAHLQTNQKDRASEILHFTSKRLQSQGQKTKGTSYATDRFMTNLSTRLNAVEAGIRAPCASGASRNSSDSNEAHGHDASKLHFTEMFAPHKTRLVIQNKRQQDMNYGEDLFTIIPMCKPDTPLRPLAKLTPKHKQLEESLSYEEQPSPTESSGGNKDGENEDLTVEKIASSRGINLARSAIAKTNLRIEQMRNSPLRPRVADDKMKSHSQFFVQKGRHNGLTLLKNGVLRYTVTK